MGLSPGPWIRDLQIALQNNDTHAKITTADQTFEAGTLGDKLLTGSSPRLLAYVTDILFSRANVERVRATMTGADTFVCEAVFMDADRVEATAKRHLTTRQAAMLASLIKARHTRVFHVSNLYTRQIPDVLSEFHGFLKQYQALDQAALEAAIAEEIARENSPS
jgi:ribonuclease Z